MGNIMLNKVCNLSCSYCFANEFVNNPFELKNLNNKNNISVEDFQYAVDFLTKSGDARIGIIGGEPTMHPEFPKLMDIVLNHPKVESVVLFTNGITLKDHLRILNSPKLNVLVNANSPNDIGQNKYDLMIESLDKVKENYLLDKVNVGINMYKEGFDFEYMIEILKRYNFKRVRTSVAVPNDLEKREMNALQYFRSMKASVFNFFKELEKIEVMPTYDCNNVPTCITTPEEKKWLMNFWKLENNANGRCNITDAPVCSPVIDVLPDLTAVRCFGMSDDLKLNIKDFTNVSELHNRFVHELDTLSFYIPTSEECVDCVHRISRECMGGCLAFKSKLMKKVSLEINQKYNSLLRLL